MSGGFVVLEGLDGVGKSTHVAMLSTWLEAAGVPHLVVREPGGTPLGEAVREVVLSRDLDVGPESELLLMLAARAALVRGVIAPALAAGRIVLADRFALSTLAYQGYGRGLGPDRVRPVLDIATGGLRPDLCVVLDLPLEDSAERRRGNTERPDRIEREGEGFRRKVREAYLALAELESGVVVLDARGTPDEVQGRIREVIATRLPTLALPSAVTRRSDDE